VRGVGGNSQLGVAAVTPHLQSLQAQNAALQQRLAVESRRRLDQAVERAVPNYREIDAMPEWHRYLLGIDALSGRVRQTLLNEAIASGNEARVVAFFRGFQQQAGSAAAPQASQAPARPGVWASARSSDKPIYTRDQIAKLYRKHQQGAYANRELEWARQEQDIIRAAAEGRVLNPVVD
jgi:hypothetical protein